MDLAKKILQSCFLLCILAFLNSCENRCYAIEEFSSFVINVDSHPEGIEGTYDPLEGGQHAPWNDAKGLVSDGKPFILQIQGEWSPWYRNQLDNQALKDLASCIDEEKMCAKKADGSSSNCICYDGQTPRAEIDQTCGTDDYSNPALCTCDPDGGDAEDYGIYHFPLSYYTKDEVMTNPDRQAMCKYDRGMGAYIGLFGPRGIDEPVRLYHLYSQGETVCTVTEKDGECKDGDGNDARAYIFRSANNALGEPSIFMKDDHDGNNGNNLDTSNDEYHVVGEAIKFKIFDRYYSDNKGAYSITILSGAGYGSGSTYNGILEFLVAIVEDTLMGERDSNGDRQGGIIEYMYKSITQDSGFMLFVQGMLVMYVTVFGMAIIMGVVEIKRSEMMSRVLKVGLILLFTSSNSWAIYNDIVVGFFYDSMNYVITMMTSLSNCALDTQTTTQLINSGYNSAACLTNNDGTVFVTPGDTSEASRFAYIDLVIMTLLSQAVAAKIVGLLIPKASFGFVFGPLYVAGILVLIGAFVLIMLIAAKTYAMNLMKIIFVLAMGPIFMCFTLFSQTNQMFKNWLSFLGARSLENIMLFAILFNFVVILNAHFIDMLSYKTCVENYNIGFISIPVLHAYVNRGLMEWVIYFFTIGGLLFMTYMILQQIPSLAGGLISIGGVSNQSGGKGGGQSSLDFANKAAGGLGGLLKGGAGIAGSGAIRGATAAGRGASAVAERSGFNSALSKLGDKANWRGKLPQSVSKRIPTLGLGARTVNAEIASARKAAKAEGLTGKAANDYIRQNATARLMDRSLEKNPMNPNTNNRDPFKFAMMGITPKFIADQMDKQLIEEPLKELMASKAKELRSNKETAALSPKEMKQQLREAGSEMLQKDHGMSKKDADNYMNKKSSEQHQTAFEQDLKSIIKDSSQISSAQAAKMTAEHPELKEQFMQNFKDQEAKENYKSEKAWEQSQRSLSESKNPFGKAAIAMGNIANAVGTARKGTINSMGNAGRTITGGSAADARQRYERELDRETKNSFAHSINPLNRSGMLRGAADYMSSSVLGRDISGGATAMAEKSNRAALLKSLKADPQENIEAKYGFKKKADALALEGKKLSIREQQKNEADIKKANAKENSARLLFQNQLNASAAKDLKPGLKAISDHKDKMYDMLSGSLTSGQDIDKVLAPQIKGMQQDLFNTTKAELLFNDGKGGVRFNDRTLVKDADGNAKYVANNESLFERVGKLDTLNKEFGNKPLNLQKGLTQDFKDVVAEGVAKTKKDAASLSQQDPDYAKKKESIDKDVAQLESMKQGLFNGNTSKIDDSSNTDYYAQIAQRFAKRMESYDAAEKAEQAKKAIKAEEAKDDVQSSGRGQGASDDVRTTATAGDDISSRDDAKNKAAQDDVSQRDNMEKNSKDIRDLHDENRSNIAGLAGLYDQELNPPIIDELDLDEDSITPLNNDLDKNLTPERDDDSEKESLEKEEDDEFETMSVVSALDEGGEARLADALDNDDIILDFGMEKQDEALPDEKLSDEEKEQLKPKDDSEDIVPKSSNEPVLTQTDLDRAVTTELSSDKDSVFEDTHQSNVPDISKVEVAPVPLSQDEDQSIANKLPIAPESSLDKNVSDKVLPSQQKDLVAEDESSDSVKTSLPDVSRVEVAPIPLSQDEDQSIANKLPIAPEGSLDKDVSDKVLPSKKDSMDEDEGLDSVKTSLPDVSRVETNPVELPEDQVSDKEVVKDKNKKDSTKEKDDALEEGDIDSQTLKVERDPQNKHMLKEDDLANDSLASDSEKEKDLEKNPEKDNNGDESKQHHIYAPGKEEIQALENLLNSGKLGENSDRAQTLLAEINQITDENPSLEDIAKIQVIVKEIEAMKADMNEYANVDKTASVAEPDIMKDDSGKTLSDKEGNTTQADIADINDTKNVDEATGLVATDVKIEFGASISDILLQGADVGVKGVDFSQIFLGVKGAKSGMDHALYSSLMVDKTQAEGMFKISKMELKMKSFELEQKKTALTKLENSGGDMSEISSLNKDINSLQTTVSELQNTMESRKQNVEKISSNLAVVESNS